MEKRVKKDERADLKTGDMKGAEKGRRSKRL
jgi:hypothetical protein